MGRAHNLRQYNLTIEQYDEMLAAQNYKCAICKEATNDSLGRKMNVDHSHISGKVLELLCGNCNRAIGLLKDDYEIVFAAALYLEKHKDTISSPESHPQ